MTISFSPVAQVNLENAQNTADSLEARVSNLLEIIDGLVIIYDNQQFRVDQRKKPENKVTDLFAGPWKNSTFQAGAVRINSNSIWDFLFTKPITDIYYSVSEVNNENNPNYVKGYFQGRRFDSIYREHKERIDFNNGLRDSITNAVEQIKNLNSVGYQTQLEQAKALVADVLIEEVRIFNEILQVVAREVNNPQSIIYKPGSPFGPFSSEEIAAFEVNFDDIIGGNNSLLTQLNLIYNRLDEIVNLPEDVLARVSLVNAGLVQNPNDPSQFDLLVPEEKDPWGIRFTYTSSFPASQFAEPLQVNEFGPSKENTIRRRNENNREGELEASLDIIERNTINARKDFYFQLLPAIKTNMPSSGSTDVPGAMPGVQFRIENNIVKHKIPGFAPVYQPIGIDCIKCTLVGMFTGNDGLDLSRTFSDDITAGLLRNGESGTINKYGPLQETIYSLYDSSKAARAIGGGASNLIGGLPEIRGNSSSTAATVPVLSEDAFRGAQDFYNEIVSQGKEVEVELNLRKGSGPYPGGSVGPFRDPETGNPKFKGLIKRMDMYYVRRDRCWFIIDLEITESGLIGKECINLTNVIEESLDLFENVKSVQNLTKEQLDDCFKSKVEIRMQHPRDTDVFVVDLATGLSYFYDKISGNVLADRAYPVSFRETMAFLGKQAKGGQLFYEDLPGEGDLLPNNGNIAAAISNLVGGRRIRVIALMTRLAQLYPINLSSEESDLSTYWLPADTFSWATNLNGTAWRLDKHTGKFYYVYDKNGSLVRDAETTTERARTLQELVSQKKLGFNDGGSVDKFVNFFLNDYISLMQIPEQNACTDIIDDLTEQQLQRAIARNNTDPGTVLETPEPTRDIFQTADFNIVPTTVTEPVAGTAKEKRKQEKEDLKAVKEAVNNGNLDALLSQAVAEFFNILEEDRINVPIPTALSPGFVTLLQREFQNDNLKVIGRSKGFTIINGTTRHVNSNKDEITVNAKFRLQDQFNYKVRNQEYILREDFAFPFSFGIKAFLNNGVKEYRVIGIKFDNRITRDTNGDGETDEVINGDVFIRNEVEEAPQDLEPSANNPPSVAPE